MIRVAIFIDEIEYLFELLYFKNIIDRRKRLVGNQVCILYK